MSWIDVTQTLQPGMVYWPGQPEPQFTRTASMDKGDMANVTRLNLSAHTGTHMDAPLHFLNGEIDMAEMPAEAMVGKGKIFEITHGNHISKKDIQEAEERVGPLVEEDKVLFKTHHSAVDWILSGFNENYVALLPDAASYLAEKAVQVIGIDYLSIAPYDNLVQVHEILLKSHIWIIEGLKLGEVEEGEYEIICTPLKIKGADGSPARVLVKRG